jgi:phage terminase large subunit-like protein
MKTKAPVMHAGSFIMVLMQFFAVCGIVTAMLHPSCVTNAQCNERAGFYCYMPEDADIGTCQMCGEAAPLPPYRSNEVYSDPERGERRKEFNVVWDMHYPQDAKGKRMETPLAFAGFNYTMVQQRCTLPIREFHWTYGRSSSGDTVVIDRGDIDRDFPWIPNERLDPRSSLFFTKFSSASSARWCAACVGTVPFDEEDGLTMTDDDTGLTVSIMNKKLLAMTNTKAMAKLDWVALLMSAYVVGLMVAGEIKEYVNNCTRAALPPQANLCDFLLP